MKIKAHAKKLRLVAVISLVMILSMLTAMLPVYAEAPVTPTVSASGVLSWDAFGTTGKYQITVVDAERKFVFAQPELYSTSYNIKDRLDYLRVESGDYFVNIYSRNNETNVKTNEFTYSYTSPFTPLATPTGLAWNGAVASWNAVENASSYSVQLIGRTGYNIINKTVYTTSYDFKDYYQNGATFKVLAEAGNYLDSEYATSSESSAYIVKFSAGNGSGTLGSVIVNPSSMGGDAQYTAPDPAGLTSPGTGKVFSKWLVEYWSGPKEGQTDFVEKGGTLTLNGDVRLVAMWTNDVYTVTFDADGYEGSMLPQSVNAGELFTFPECSFFSPYVSMEFDHWEIEGKDTQYDPGDTCELFKNTTVKAVWKNKFASNPVAVKWGLEGDTAFGIGAPVSVNIEAMCQNNEFKTAYLGNEVKAFYWYSDGVLVGTGPDYTLKLSDGGKKIKAGVYFLDGTVIYSPETQALNEITHVNMDMPIPCVGTAINKDLSAYDSNGLTVNSASWVDENFSSVTTVADNLKYDCFLKVTAPDGYKLHMVYDAGVLVYPKLISKADSYSYNVADTSGNNKFVTFVMRFSPVSSFTVSFNAGEGSGTMANQTVEPNAEHKTQYVLPDCSFTAPNGKAFKAWSVNGVEKQAGEQIDVYADTVIKALWKGNQVIYAYYADGECKKNGNTTIEAPYTLLDPTAMGIEAPEGKQFKGWALGNENAEPVAAGTVITVTSDINIYAVWENIPEHVHAHGSEWKTDADNHWNECECTDKANVGAHADTNADGKCDVCAYQMTTPAPDNSGEGTQNGGNASTETEAPTTDSPADTSEKKSGCGSTVALSALATVGIIGMALAFKKKED